MQASDESTFPPKPTHLTIVARFSFKEIAYTTFDDKHETSSTFTFTKMYWVDAKVSADFLKNGFKRCSATMDAWFSCI